MKKTIAVYGLLVVFSLACFVVASFIHGDIKLLGFSFDGILAKHIVEEVGVAGLIGFYLALTIERLSAAEFKKLALEERAEIKRDVFHYVFGRKIPEAIRQEIDSQILDAKFLRRNHSVIFELTTIKDNASGESFILSECTLSYEIHNITPQDETFPLRHGIDKPPAKALLDQVKFTHLKVDNCETPFDWDEDALKDKQTDDGARILLTPKRDVIVNPRQPTKVLVKYKGIRNLKGGRIDFTFTNYTCDLAIKVNVPNREICVLAGAFSPHPLEKGASHNPEAGSYDWTLKYPLLSYQGIYVTWDPVTVGV